MSKTVSTTEAKNSLNALMNWSEENDEEIVIENHGRPRVVILPVSRFEELSKLEDRVRRQEALARLRKFEEAAVMRNADLTEEEVLEMSVRASREMIDDMVERGVISFERDLHRS